MPRGLGAGWPRPQGEWAQGGYPPGSEMGVVMARRGAGGWGGGRDPGRSFRNGQQAGRRFGFGTGAQHGGRHRHRPRAGPFGKVERTQGPAVEVALMQHELEPDVRGAGLFEQPHALDHKAAFALAIATIGLKALDALNEWVMD